MGPSPPWNPGIGMVLSGVRPVRYYLLTSGSPSSKIRYLSSLSDSKKRIALEDKTSTPINPVGIQYLSPYMIEQILGKNTKRRAPSKQLVELSKLHLKDHNLLGKKTTIERPINIRLPPILGSTLDEHFYRIGREMSEPYLSNALKFIEKGIPAMPKEGQWLKTAGWTKYTPGEAPVSVEYPDDEAIVFDVETLYKISEFSVMACAVSSNSWYCWLSPWLLGETENPRQLIPLGSQTEKMVIGHNISYDRKRTKDEYHLQRSKNFFLDTMSLHVATNGMCSRQRPTWMKMRKQKKEDMEDSVIGASVADEHTYGLSEYRLEYMDSVRENPWFNHSSLNNLHDVAALHCGIEVDKSRRDLFKDLDREGTLDQLQNLISYCAADVEVTFRVVSKVLPRFLQLCPHPVSFAALGELSSVFLPINNKWEKFIKSAEDAYQQNEREIYEELTKLAIQACELKDSPEIYENDPWLSQLDWTVIPLRMVKGKKKGDPERPAARQKMPGMPKWYKDLFATNDAPMNITVRSRIAARLLKLRWDGYPLVWSDLHGYVFRLDRARVQDVEKYKRLNYIVCDMNEETNIKFKDDVMGIYFRVPHKDGAKGRCTNPMAKGYIAYFEQGILSSEYECAKKAIQLNSQNSYWTSARERISKQMPIYSEDTEMGLDYKTSGKEFGLILPNMIPMGTITRRAVEDSWLTASNAKKNRIGSELKAMIQAPPGYKFVGADVDSEELWIASLMGDSLFEMHGGCALGWMTLEGTKSEGTDLHSKTSSILGISRNEAKIFNYGRIYGAGLNFAVQLLRRFNPMMSLNEAEEVAAKLYSSTKGVKTKSSAFETKQFWRGGTESVVFNRLEEIATSDHPTTPVLGAGITEALTKQFLGSKGGYLTSRINWSIQSSGVDYLHLLICSMDYLIKAYGIQARLSLTVHDEIRYLVKEEDQYRASFALQIANLWTRAMFCNELGLTDVPQSCAFFSLVDIDHVLRKEVDLDCVTPSHPKAIPPGTALSITELLEKCPKLTKKTSHVKQTVDAYMKFDYQPRQSVLTAVGGERFPLDYLKAQLTSDNNEFRSIERSVRFKLAKERGNSKGVMDTKSKVIDPSNLAAARKEVAAVSEDTVDPTHDASDSVLNSSANYHPSRSSSNSAVATRARTVRVTANKMQSILDSSKQGYQVYL